MAKKKKKNKLGAKAIFARILVVILVTAIGGVASFFGFKTYFSNKLKKDKKAEIAKQLKEESKEKVDVGMIQTGNSIVIRIYHNRNQEMIFVPLRQDMILKLTKSGKKAVKETLGINVSKATVADVIKATKEDGALMKKQVENTLGITINSYELLSRKKFVTLINKAGDIKVEFDQAMSYTDSTDKYVTLNEGENSLNGTAVYSKDYQFINKIPEDVARAYIREARMFPGCEITINKDNMAYFENVGLYRYMIDDYGYRGELVDNIEDYLDDVCKISIFHHNCAEKMVSQEFVDKWSKTMNIAVSGKFWLDCTNQGGNKGSALQHFQEAYKISPDETLAFGDNINDIEMLKRASHSFAVENAREEVKEVANFIAPSYKEDGVLQVLKAVLRGELA